MTKLLIFGSRTFQDRNRLSAEVSKLIKKKGWNLKKLEIVAGGAPGADTLGKEWAQQNAIIYTEFAANWDLYGNKAGPLRNEVQGEYCAFNYAIGFWDGHSRGTAHMISVCEEKSIELTLIKFKL